MNGKILLLVALLISPAIGDRLPPGMPENQLLSVETTLNIIGFLDESTRTAWIVSKEDPLENNPLNASEVLSLVIYRDTQVANGGSIAETKNYEFDSRSRGRRTYNIEQEKVLTYRDRDGSLLTGSERLLLDNAGNYSASDRTVACVFAEPIRNLVPAFCNVVEAKSDLVNINHARISTTGRIRSAGGFSTPAGMSYRIAVTPDSTTGNAKGTVWTSFAGSIMEARDTNTSIDYNRTAATNSWKDQTRVSGGIQNLQKTFGYASGVRV